MVLGIFFCILLFVSGQSIFLFIKAIRNLEQLITKRSMELRINGLNKVYSNGVKALDNVSLEIGFYADQDEKDLI